MGLQFFSKSYKTSSIHRLIIKCALLSLSFCWCCHQAAAQQPDKVQQAVDGIKAANYCEDEDYHTDGQRVVWVKSYKKWTPNDWGIINKERPGLIKFLAQLIEHNRLDALAQLLPDYYKMHGGIKSFAAAINEQYAALKATQIPPQ